MLVTADHSPGGPIQPGQPGQPEPGQDPVHRGGMHAQQIADPGRPPATVDSDRDDPPLPLGGGPLGGTDGAAGTILHPVLTMGTITAGPAGRCRHRHLEPFSRPLKGPPVLDHAPGQPEPALRRQERVSMGH
jgi:hypothetical protein